MRVKRIRAIPGKSYLLIGAIILSVLAAELLLRAFAIHDHFIYPPRLHRIFHPHKTVMPGVEGESHFRINGSGIRGADFSPDQKWRVLSIGGSTTECLYLDDTETWPSLLERSLNAASADGTVWVGNAGKSGHTTRHHILAIHKFLEQYPRLDTIVLLVGVNDFQKRLAHDKEYRPFYYDSLTASERLELLEKTFAVFPRHDPGGPAYRRTQIWQALAKAKNRLFPSPIPEALIQDESGRVLIGLRKHRKNALMLRDTLPDLTEALDEYGRNIDRIIDIAREKGVCPVFVTQPVMWRENLAPHLEDLLWFGRVGPPQHKVLNEYYSVKALAKGMAAYNKTLGETCRARNVAHVDLAAILPADTTTFYDDCHFNESGARRVADALTEALCAR